MSDGLQVNPDGKLVISSDGKLVVAAAGKPCCCGGVTDCCTVPSYTFIPSITPDMSCRGLPGSTALQITSYTLPSSITLTLAGDCNYYGAGGTVNYKECPSLDCNDPGCTNSSDVFRVRMSGGALEIYFLCHVGTGEISLGTGSMTGDPPCSGAVGSIGTIAPT